MEISELKLAIAILAGCQVKIENGRLVTVNRVAIHYDTYNNVWRVMERK